MASQASNLGITRIVNRNVDYAADTIKAMLMKNTYVHNPDTDFASSITADEGTGTTRQTLATKTINEDDANNRCWLDADNVTFTAVVAGQTVSGVVIIKDTGVDATSTILWWNQFSAAIVCNGGDIQVAFDATGLLRFQI